MKDPVREHAPTFLIAAVVAAAMLSAPAVARTVVDFARNAHKVDGRHAVGPKASLQKRAGKLVATNRKGRLPNSIIRKAPRAGDADRVGGFGPTAFIHGCQTGAIRGQAHVTPAVGPDLERVPGFATTHGGPVSPEGTNCHVGEALARRVNPGLYDARLATVAWTCTETMPAGIVTAFVSIESPQPLLATYEPHCENNNVHIRVRITELDGSPRDAAFSVALLGENGIPIP